MNKTNNEEIKSNVDIANEKAERAIEKSVEQVKLEGVVERLKAFLKEENVAIVPKMRYTESGILPDIEVRLLADPVKNIYEEESNEQTKDESAA